MFLTTPKTCSTLTRVLESILFLFRELPVSGGPSVRVIRVLRRRRGIDDGGVDDGTLGESHPSGFKMGVDPPEDPPAKVMGLEKVAELADRPFVRDSPRCRGLCQQANPWIPYRRALLRLRGR
jgi:hypothetical protein